MKAFTFQRPATPAQACSASATAGAVLKAGGIDLLDRMKERVDEPDRVVWLGAMTEPSLRRIARGPDGQLVIGSLVTLAEVAASDEVRAVAPALVEAAASAASPQIRHQATVGGNLCQHTRCGYYRHRSFPCLRRGGDACPVLDPRGVQQDAAIFANRPCASASPSSLAPVLGAYGAEFVVRSADGSEGRVPFHAFWAPPARGRASDTSLAPGDIILRVEIPKPGGVSAYEEVRQKAAFDWALASCAVRLSLGADGKVTDAGVWLGAVAPTPYRAEAAEAALVGKVVDADVAAAAGEAAAKGATPLPGNGYKVDLVKVVVGGPRLIPPAGR